MDSMLYPTIPFFEERGFIPRILLPRDYKEIVPQFYKQNRKKTVESYAREIEKELLEGKLDIRLNWDEEVGLRNIGIGASGGLDLDEESAWPMFREHNLGGKTTKSTGLATGLIAMCYVSELLKCR